MPEPILETEGLTKSFGGLDAVRDVTLAFAAGGLHAIIGPNGAGKTTLLNLLSGETRPSRGTVRFKGRDITGASPDAVSRLGVGRSFQRTNVFPALSCLENCWIAAHAHAGRSRRFLRGSRAAEDRAAAALAECGLAHAADRPAAALSYGEQRQLEIGMLLATAPALMLLDEPLAGMGQEESLKVVALLRRLAAERSLILIEHDMDAVFAIADRITVMVNGKVLETGTVAQIRASPAVQEAYLGREGA